MRQLLGVIVSKNVSQKSGETRLMANQSCTLADLCLVDRDAGEGAEAGWDTSGLTSGQPRDDDD